MGTRAAAFAPVHDLGLLVIWDDGDDLHAEPRAPYPHAREVLLTRAEREGTAMLVGGFARSVEAQQLLRTGWAQPLALERGALRTRARIEIAGADEHSLDRDPLARSARLPSEAHRLVRDALATGPVLVQTPRTGYAATLACARCRTPARCGACQGPLAISSRHRATRLRLVRHRGGRRGPARSAASVGCGRRWSARPARPRSSDGRSPGPWSGCRRATGCSPRSTGPPRSSWRLRAPSRSPTGATPRWSCWTPGSPSVSTTCGPTRRRCAGGATRSGCCGRGGRALAVGDPAHPALQALVRWDHAGFAEREAEARREAHLPPASRLATLTGELGAVDDVLTLLDRPEGTEVLGPVPVGGLDPGQVRAVVRVPLARGAALSDALGELQRLRSARKLDPVRIQVDPLTL